MRKFVSYCLLFLTPVIIIVAGTEILLRLIPNDYSFKKNYLETKGRDIELLYLGNSHSFFGLNPEWSQNKAFNTAYVSQTPMEDIRILKKYGACMPNLKSIVVPVDVFTLYETLESGKEYWRTKFYAIYYGLNDRRLKNQFEVLNGSFRSNTERLISYYIRDSASISCNKTGWGLSHQSKDAQNLATTSILAAKRHSLKKTEAIFQQNLSALEAICLWAGEKNIKVIFVLFPAYRTYTSLLPSQQLDETRDAIYPLVLKYHYTGFFDLLNDNQFAESDFYDADHLNERGAKKLTHQIDSIVNRLSIK